MHRRPNTIERVDADETKLIEVHKHSIGIISIYTQTIVGMVVAVGLTLYILPSVISDVDVAVLIGSLFAIAVILFSVAVLFIATYIFRQNRMIVTDRNVTQILQYGLFSRKVSQLNIVNVEDVTSVQNGLISTAMNYGTLRIETAGEQSNFDFNYCPNSGHVAKLILDAREKMLGQMDDDAPIDVSAQKVKGRARRSIPKPKPILKKQIDVQGLGAEIMEHSNVTKKKLKH